MTIIKGPQSITDKNKFYSEFIYLFKFFTPRYEDHYFCHIILLFLIRAIRLCYYYYGVRVLEKCEKLSLTAFILNGLFGLKNRLYFDLESYEIL